jgi:hypothetical protein
MMKQQVELKSGTLTMVTWVEANKVKVGNVITLKNFDDPDREWRVMSVGEAKDSSEIYRGWNNNI